MSGAAASVPLAVLGTDVQVTGSVAISSGSLTFESEDFTPSQIVELSAATFEGTRFGVRASTSSLAEGQIVAAVESGVWFGASKSSSLRPDSTEPDYLVGSTLDSIGSVMGTGEADIWVFSSFARPFLLGPDPVGLDGNNWRVKTDGVYQGIVEGDPLVLESAGQLLLVKVVVATVEVITVGDISIPTTWVTVAGGNPLINDEVKSLKLWYGAVAGARLVKIPPSEVSFDQIVAAAGVTGDQVVILDSLGHVITAGNTTAVPPIRILSNLALATRGETIKNEILGSGNAAIPFQSFRLEKSPLTYLADPTAPSGRRSTLEVYVNGQKWRQAQSFYGALPTHQIYVVRHDEDHQTQVVFGDGELGQRLPTGGSNVVATYRFGVGGNVPANSITTLKKPIKGIRKVFNPLPATGGKEPPTPEQMRREAPLGLLVLGRLVSLPDFEAETRRYGNVVNAKARWGWNSAGEDATVQVWFATRDAGDPSADLRVYLEGMAEPNTQVSVAKATPVSGALKIDLVIDPRERAEDVELEVARRLFDDWDGALSVRNAEIGGRFHRSAIYAAIHAVPGVLGVNAITVNDVDVPAFHAFEEGTYLDLENTDLIVGNTAAGLRLFGSN